MSNQDRDKIMERIRRLLAMAEDTSSPNEAAIAARRAEKLMREHQLTQVDVLVKDLDGDSVEISTVDHVQTIYGPRYKSSGQPRWVGVIAVAAALMNECEADMNHVGHTRFYGVAGDAQVAAAIFQYLIKETSRLAGKYPGGRAEKNAFRRGCASALQTRAREIKAERERQFQETSSGTALVLLKQALIEQRTGRKFEYETGKASPVDAAAYHAGRLAGRNINLNDQLEAGEKRQAIK